MAFKLRFTQEARDNLDALEKNAGLAKRFRAMRKALGYLEVNPRHQGLTTHK